MQPARNYKWLTLIATGIMILLVNIDGTVVNIAVPVIGRSLQIDLNKMQWVINIYLLFTAVLFTTGGRLADLFGKRRIFLIGSLLFCLASLAAGLSQSFDLLLIARAVQGIGFAFTLSLAIMLTAEAFPQAQQGAVVGIQLTLSGLGQVLGPTLGGVILHFVNWHWIFLINVPFALLSCILTLCFCHKDKPKAAGESLDIRGICLFSLGVSGLIFGLSQWVHQPHLAPIVLIGGAVLLAVYYLHSRRARHPLIDFSLFKITHFTAVNVVRFAVMFGWFVILFSIPIYLQNMEGFNPLQTGLIILAVSICFGIVAPIAGRIADHVGIRRPIMIGLFSCTAAVVLILLPITQTTLWLLIIALVLYGFGTGILITLTVHGVMLSLPPERKGAGTGLFFTLAFVAASLGLALSSLVYSNLNWHHFNYLSHTLKLPTSATFQQALQHVVSGASNISTLGKYVSTRQLHSLQPLIHESFQFGLSVMMVACLVFMIFGIMMYRILPRSKTH